MPDLKGKPEPFKYPARQISASALNAIAAAVPRIITGGGQVNVAKFGDKDVLVGDVDVPGKGYFDTRTRHFVVMQELDDYLLCIPFSYNSVPPQPWNPLLGQYNTTQILSVSISGGVATVTTQEDPNNFVPGQFVSIYGLNLNFPEVNGVGIVLSATNNTFTVSAGSESDAPETDVNGIASICNSILPVAKPRLLQKTPFNGAIIPFIGYVVQLVYSTTVIGQRTVTPLNAFSYDPTVVYSMGQVVSFTDGNIYLYNNSTAYMGKSPPDNNYWTLVGPNVGPIIPKIQNIYPAYTVGDIITTRKAPTGYGVQVNNLQLEDNVQADFAAGLSLPIMWEDSNVEARTWQDTLDALFVGIVNAWNADGVTLGPGSNIKINVAQSGNQTVAMVMGGIFVGALLNLMDIDNPLNFEQVTVKAVDLVNGAFTADLALPHFNPVITGALTTFVCYTIVPANISAGSNRVVTPLSMIGIVKGVNLSVVGSFMGVEVVEVIVVNSIIVPNAFTADFVNSYDNSNGPTQLIGPDLGNYWPGYLVSRAKDLSGLISIVPGGNVLINQVNFNSVDPGRYYRFHFSGSTIITTIPLPEVVIDDAELETWVQPTFAMSAAAAPAGNGVIITPNTMIGIFPGANLWMQGPSDPNNATGAPELTTVISVTKTTFTVNLQNLKTAGFYIMGDGGSYTTQGYNLSGYIVECPGASYCFDPYSMNYYCTNPAILLTDANFQPILPNQFYRAKPTPLQSAIGFNGIGEEMQGGFPLGFQPSGATPVYSVTPPIIPGQGGNGNFVAGPISPMEVWNVPYMLRPGGFDSSIGNVLNSLGPGFGSLPFETNMGFWTFNGGVTINGSSIDPVNGAGGLLVNGPVSLLNPQQPADSSGISGYIWLLGILAPWPDPSNDLGGELSVGPVGPNFPNNPGPNGFGQQIDLNVSGYVYAGGDFTQGAMYSCPFLEPPPQHSNDPSEAALVSAVNITIDANYIYGYIAGTWYRIPWNVDPAANPF